MFPRRPVLWSRNRGGLPGGIVHRSPAVARAGNEADAMATERGAPRCDGRRCEWTKNKTHPRGTLSEA
eukprot:3684155-Alexandrium_andersonii.AAC.1